MIQANDLRIGNLFYLNDDDLIENQNVYEGIAIHKITGEDVNMADFSNDDFNMFYKPIPITEEWILKFGFTKDTHVDGYKVKGIDCYWIKEMRSVLFLKSDIRGINYPYIEMGQDHVRLDYIHQLQNLYFALTQKELTLKDA